MPDSELVAVIDIGSTAIRLVIAEATGEGSWNTLERAGKPVTLGRDAFQSGVIARETIGQSLRILRGFKELLSGYQIAEKDVTVIATSALRDARNRDTFVDRVEIKTGFTIDIVEGIEENRLTYMAVQHALKDYHSTMAKSNSFIIEVGGGSTELMLLRRGKVVAAHSLNIGTVRIEQQLESTEGSETQRVRFLRENIRNVRGVLANEFDLEQVRHFVAVGADARLAADRVGESVNPMYSTISKHRFDEFVRSLQSQSIEECVARLQIAYDQAESLATSLLMYQLFLEGTNADMLIVPQASIRDGVLLSITSGADDRLLQEFDSQVLESAYSIGRKYYFDESHSKHVADLSLSLFDQLQDEHALGDRERLLLHTAAILHDIGTYVKASGHHKHGQYLVENSDIFGLHADDIKLISNIVRYHRNTAPLSSHISYISLSREDRMTVLKLSSILRVADALDRAHVQRIRDVSIDKHGDDLIVYCDYQGGISIERYGLSTKGSMFEEVFGMKISLVQKSAQVGA